METLREIGIKKVSNKKEEKQMRAAKFKDNYFMFMVNQLEESDKINYSLL